MPGYDILEPEGGYEVLEPERDLILRDLQAARAAQPGFERDIGITDFAAAPLRFLEDVPRTLINAPSTIANALGGNAPTIPAGRGAIPISAPTPGEAQNLYSKITGDPTLQSEGNLGLISAGSEFIEGLTDPKFAPLALSGGGGLRPFLRGAIPTVIGTEAVNEVPEVAGRAGEASVTGTPFEQGQAYGRLGLTTAIPAAIATPTALAAYRQTPRYALGTAGREMSRQIARAELGGGEGQIVQPVEPPVRPGFQEGGVPWTRIGPQRDPRFTALREEGVTAEDAVALINGDKTVKEVVEGNFNVTPKGWPQPGGQGHAEAWIEGYNQAIERLTNIIKEDPYAIYKSATTSLRNVLKPGRPGEGAREVPADVTGEETSARGGGVADQTAEGQELAAGGKDVLSPLSDPHLVSQLSPEQFVDALKTAGKQASQVGHEMGVDLTPEQKKGITLLRDDAKREVERITQAADKAAAGTEQDAAINRLNAASAKFNAFNEAVRMSDALDEVKAGSSVEDAATKHGVQPEDIRRVQAMKPLPAGESFAEHLSRLEKADQDLFNRNIAQVPAGATAIKLRDPSSGKTATITPDSVESGKWRLTYYQADGTPWGHAVLDTRDQAIQSALGLYGKGTYGPPHLGKGYEVVEARGGKAVEKATPKAAVPEAQAANAPTLDMLASKHDLTRQQAEFVIQAFQSLPEDANPEALQKAYLKLALPSDMPSEVGLGKVAGIKGAREVLNDLREASAGGKALAVRGPEMGERTKRSLPPPAQAEKGAPETAAPVPAGNLTPAERVELNELRIVREDRGKLGRLNAERLAELEAKEKERSESQPPAPLPAKPQVVRDAWGVTKEQYQQGIDQAAPYFIEFNQKYSKRRVVDYLKEVLSDILENPEARKDISKTESEAVINDPIKFKVWKEDFLAHIVQMGSNKGLRKMFARYDPEVNELYDRIDTINENRSHEAFLIQKLMDDHSLSSEEALAIVDDYLKQGGRKRLYDIDPGLGRFMDMHVEEDLGERHKRFEFSDESTEPLEARIGEGGGLNNLRPAYGLTPEEIAMAGGVKEAIDVAAKRAEEAGMLERKSDIYDWNTKNPRWGQIWTEVKQDPVTRYWRVIASLEGNMRGLDIGFFNSEDAARAYGRDFRDGRTFAIINGNRWNLMVDSAIKNKPVDPDTAALLRARGRTEGTTVEGKTITADQLRNQYEPPKGEPLEARMPRRETRNPFEMDDDDLRGLFNERFGRQEPTGAPGEFGRPGKYSFPTYAKFRTWMDERYAALDIEGMRNAFSEAPTENKIRYIKENKGADDHKRAWIANLATGAPLPKERPPVVQTPVTPTGGPARPGQPPRPPPPRPAPPPPPPRTPTPYRKFDVMALTQLFRQFEKTPKVNERLTRAYGRFIPSTEAVEIKARLMWDTKLAERVLGHEIGHFLDLAIQYIGKGKDLGAKLEPLQHLRSRIGTDAQLREDARSLSRQWRGPFANGDRYRDSANELFADYMSAMFNNPEWVNQQYPRLHDAMTNLLGSKPEFRKAYSTLESWLQGGTMTAEWMAQQEASVRRTIDDLLTTRPRHRESFRDVLKGAFVSMWHRAFQAEGRPAKLGQSITDELEYNQSWGAKENSLFADDFTQKVQPALEKVDPDPIKARSDLHAYSQARRTIGERRAAGRWIEQNPDDARTMLTAILDLDDSLRSKFGAALDAAADSELYDLSSVIFREVHDRGESYVKRIAREIDNLDIDVGGQAALNAFNVRGKLLNPGGLTEAQAVKVLQELRGRLTADQWASLELAAKNLRDLLFDTQRKAFEEGLIPAKIWRELIEPNKDNYLPYAVLDYWEGKVRAGVMPQKGTAMDIADVTVAAQLKVAALNAWRQKQRQVQLLRDAYAAGGTTIPVGERLRRASDIDRIRQRGSGDDVSRAVLWQDGRPHVVEFPKDPGKTLELAMEQTSFYEHLYSWLADAGNLTHGLMQMYTTLSIPFLLFRNPIRGARTGGLRVGFRAIGKQYLNPADIAHATALAKNYADAAFGAPMLPEVRELVDQQMLLPPRLASAMVRDAANLRELLENGGILATQLRQLRGHQWPWWKGGELGRRAFEVAEKVFTGYEAFEKIQNYLAAKARGATESQAVAIGRRAGIPKPGVGGHFSLPMEVFFPWTRVHIQGLRATMDTLRDPEYRKGFVTRFMITEGMPRVLKVAVGAGVASGAISWLLAPDEDPKDPVMSEVFRRISPYKMALDDIVPLMLYDPRKGQYHYFNDFKKGGAIPQHFEVVSFRVPASEEGRLWGVLMYQAMISVPGVKEKMARPGEDIFSNTTKWAANYLIPGISPAITTTASLKKMILEGKNPEDPYRGQPAANKQLFDAGGSSRAQAIAGYTLNQLGGPGELAAVMAMNFGVLDPRAADALKKRLSMDKTPLIERLPLAKNMFSFDNYAAYRTEKEAQLAETQLRARARLVMSESVRGLYDYYWRNNDRKDLQPADRRRLAAASYFVNSVWGDLKRPNSFYSRAAHAAGSDGSQMARETVRRDLDAAAATALAAFQR